MLISNTRLVGRVGGQRRRRDLLPRRQSLGHNLLNGLVEFWPLDEQAGTRRGVHAGLHLTDNNTVTGADGVGYLASQLTAANSEYFSRTSEAAINCGDIDCCWAGWINGTTLNRQNVFSKWAAGVASDLAYILEYQNGGPYLSFGVSPVSNGTGSAFVASTTFGGLSTSTWYFFYTEHNSVANTIGISVNAGTLDTTSYSLGIYASSTIPLEIGRSGATIPRYWDGLFQRFGFWKRVLTADERTYLYNGGRGRSYPFV